MKTGQPATQRRPGPRRRVTTRHMGFLIDEAVARRLYAAQRSTGLTLTAIVHASLRSFLPTLERTSSTPFQ